MSLRVSIFFLALISWTTGEHIKPQENYDLEYNLKTVNNEAVIDFTVTSSTKEGSGWAIIGLDDETEDVVQAHIFAARSFRNSSTAQYEAVVDNLLKIGWQPPDNFTLVGDIVETESAVKYTVRVNLKQIGIKKQNQTLHLLGGYEEDDDGISVRSWFWFVKCKLYYAGDMPLLNCDLDARMDSSGSGWLGLSIFSFLLSASILAARL